MENTNNICFWPIEEYIFEDIKVVLQGTESGILKESLMKLEILKKQTYLIDFGIKRINERLLIDRVYKPSALIIGKIKDADRIWNDGAIEYLSEDNFIFRVFMSFDKNDMKFKYSNCNYKFDIYRLGEVNHEDVIKMDVSEEEDGIIYVGNIDVGEFNCDKEIQSINDEDNEKYLLLFDKMEKHLLDITANAEKYLQEVLNDKSKKIIDIIQVTACEFTDASIKKQDGLCIEYSVSDDDIFQVAYTSYQVRVLENGNIHGVGIHV